MKVTHGSFKFSMGFLVLFLLLGGVLQAQTTTFTYQGRLTEGSNPANGVYDLEVRAFDAATSGNQVGTTKTFADITVTSGILNLTIDLGATAFPGADRWVEVRVRPGASFGPYTTLTPRQQITSTPYAIQSVNATQLGGVAANQFIQTSDQRLLSELSTSSGFMIAGTNNAAFCAEGTCRIVSVNGVTTSTGAGCGADGCMISGGGGNQVAYCNKDLCTTTAVNGPSATVRCAGDGCMIPAPNQAVYCSKGACQTLNITGATASSTVRCGEDGCMITASNQAIYCNRGTCRTESANGVTTTSTVVCSTRGCVAPGTDLALYCFQGACQLLSLSGITPASNVASFVK